MIASGVDDPRRELGRAKDPHAVAALREQAAQPDRDVCRAARLPGGDEELHELAEPYAASSRGAGTV